MRCDGAQAAGLRRVIADGAGRKRGSQGRNRHRRRTDRLTALVDKRAPEEAPAVVIPLPGVIETQADERFRLVVVFHFDAAAVVKLGVVARRCARQVDEIENGRDIDGAECWAIVDAGLYPDGTCLASADGDQARLRIAWWFSIIQ